MPTGITYLDEVINPTAGCLKVSLGCCNCYAVRDAWRLMHNPNSMISAKYADTVEKINGKLCWTGQVNQNAYDIRHFNSVRSGIRIGVGFNSDLFHPNVPLEFIAAVIRSAVHRDNCQFFFLTKRVGRMVEVSRMLDDRWNIDLAYHSHIFLGTTIEHWRYRWRLNILEDIGAASIWVSLEPLLSSIDLELSMYDVRWVVAGGETGKGARYMNPDWAREIRDQCRAAGVPVYVKQMSGKEHIPDDLQIRELPQCPK